MRFLIIGLAVLLGGCVYNPYGGYYGYGYRPYYPPPPYHPYAYAPPYGGYQGYGSQSYPPPSQGGGGQGYPQQGYNEPQSGPPQGYNEPPGGGYGQPPVTAAPLPEQPQGPPSDMPGPTVLTPRPQGG